MKKPKMVVVVRKDLEMSSGKIAAQAGHAVANLMLGDRNEHFVDWISSGMKKVCLEGESEAHILELEKKANERGVPCYVVRDAGLTSVAPGTVTCIGIGPASEQKMKKITGSLKLYD